MSGPVKRHRINILKASGAVGTRGEPTGATTTVASSVPCSIETLSGRELEIAKQRMANVEYRVKLHPASSWNLDTKHWLVWPTKANKKLSIGHIADTETQNLTELTLLCGEQA